MELTDYLTFLLIALVATASPGPAVLLAVTNAVTLGMRRTLVAIMGNVTGIVLLAALSSIGLGALIHASETLFQLVKWIGGLYLIYLGIRLWRSGLGRLPVEGVCVASRSPVRLFFQAFMVAVSNPKAIAFCTALFPQFVEPTTAMLPQFTLLAGTFGLLSFTFLCGYALMASRSSGWLQNTDWSVRFNRITGGLFVGLGSLLIAGER
ncbi:LysE family translocator [Sedimenticola sp.]|uniref:LysE family translocator n=1 Tax=Sedimenticola sp. TaxID=1940285 RepID=UPI002590B3D1|nr:LysE family translocator [Sedimenticola sp.]MCW8903006.1 LysE family translocator [Sedimenticola sp.]